MNKKRFTAGLLALTLVFGGTALPGSVVYSGVTASAASSDTEVLTYGDYEYTIYNGTVEITKYNGTDEVVDIPAEIDGLAVTSIGRRAFYECGDLLEVKIPDGVKNLGAQSFCSCKKLIKVEMPDSVETLGGSVFATCIALERVTLSSKLTEIEIATFDGCENLTDVELPSGIKSIGEAAFRACYNLDNIDLPEGLETIKDYAFQNCKKIVSISIPDTVTYIGTMAFYACTSLEDVKLSSNVDYINNSNFYRCTSLKELVAPASLKTIGGNTFTSNYRSADENKEPSFTLKCYNGSAAEKHALANATNFKVVDIENKTEYPELRDAKFAKVARINYSDYFQFRLNWTEVEGAQQYGVAVNLAGKWKVQAYTDAKTTTFTSPKLKAGSKYDVVICAKVNGKWDTSDLANRAFTIAVK